MRGEPEWADLVWAAVRRRDEGAIAALARRADVGAVMRWVADGPGAHRWLTGRLLVEGAAIGEEHTATFLDDLRHALRMADADFPVLAAAIPAARETLAAALPGADWEWPWSLGPRIATALAAHDKDTVVRVTQEMIADPATTDVARCSAAGVLATVDERHVAHAVDVLFAGAGRWHAIEVLVDLAPRLADDQIDRVAESLRDVLRRQPLPKTQVAVARLLARLGPRFTTEAVRLLRVLPHGEDDAHDGEGRAEAARTLLEIDPANTDDAVALLRVVIDDWPLSDRLHAAATLAGLGPEYEAEAAAAVRTVLRGGSATVAAARTLAGLGRRYTEEAAGILRAERDDFVAATELAALGPPHTAEAADALLALIPGPSGPAAARALAAIGPRQVDSATGALRRLLAESTVDSCARVLAVTVLADLDDRHDEDVAAALRVVAATTATPFPLTRHLLALARGHPRHTAAVADTLGAVLIGAVTRLTPPERGLFLGAVRDLTAMSPGHPAAVPVLRAVIADPTDVSEQLIAAVALVREDPTTVDEVIDLLESLVTADGGAPALVKLTGLRHEHPDEVTDALRRIHTHPRLDPGLRDRVDAELGRTASGSRDDPQR